MQQLIILQSRSRLAFLAAVLVLIGVAFALPACIFSSSHCDPIPPPDASVQAAHGITYIGVLGSVMAVRATDGSQLWHTTVGGDASSMTLDKGVLYVGSGTFLTAVQASDGKHLWQFQGAGLSSSRQTSPIVADGTVYVASTSTYGIVVSAVRASDGKLLWHYTLNNANRSSLVLDNNVLYVSSNASISALRPSDGKLLWFTSQPTFTFTVRDGEVFTYSLTTAVALRSSDGKLLWSFNLGTTQGADNSTITPTGSGIVYVNTWKILYALHARDGKLLWSAPADGHMKPVIVGNVLYMLSADEHASALKADDGTVLWKSPSILYNTLADANNGAIYAGGFVDPSSQTFTAFALKMSDGSSLWRTLGVSGKPRLVVDGIVYFTLSSISCDTPLAVDVYAVQSRDGKNLWHVHRQP